MHNGTKMKRDGLRINAYVKARSAAIFVGLIIFALSSVCVRASEGTGADADVAQSFLSSDGITWYVRGIEGKLQSAVSFAGTEKTTVSEYARLGDHEGRAPKTLILVDNSHSVGYKANGKEKIKTILTRLLWNHQSEERIALKTFDTEAHTVVDYTDNYDELRLAVEKLEYVDQDTYLRNVLYHEILELSGDGEDDYSRIILVSDGTDDSLLGYSYEELTGLISDEAHRLPIYTIGMKYEPKVSDLDKLFAISRMTNSPYFLLEDYEDESAVADAIREDAQSVSFFRMQLPVNLRNGDTRALTLAVTTDKGDYTVTHTQALPVASLEELEQLEEERQEFFRTQLEEEKRITGLESDVESVTAALEVQKGTLEETASALEEEKKAREEAASAMEEQRQAIESAAAALEAKQTEWMEDRENAGTEKAGDGTEPEEDEEEKARQSIFDYYMLRNIRNGIWLASGVMLLMLLSSVIYGDRTRRIKRRLEEVTSGPAPADAAGEAGSPAALKEHVILQDVSSPDIRHVIPVGTDRILGRSRSRCDIAFPEDRSMAARQARIFFRDGKAYLENLDTVGTTRLNNEIVNGSAPLMSGAELLLGNTRIRVLYE